MSNDPSSVEQNLMATPVGNVVMPQGNAELAIRYKQGDRTMYVLVPDVDLLVDTMAAPETYDPRKKSSKVRNRPESRGHVRNIAHYLEEEPNFILGSLIQYIKPGEIPFIELWTRGRKTVGLLDIPRQMRPFATGDGRHRGAGINDALKVHDLPGDPVRENLLNSSVPVILVEEDDPVKAAQDFVDLGSTKPIPPSLRNSLDQRQPINRFCLDLSTELNLFRKGELIVYTSETVSKLSPQILKFQSLRFAIGTVLIGFAARSVDKWNTLANELVVQDEKHWKDLILHVFDSAASVIGGWRELTADTLSGQQVKEKYVSCTAAGFNAFAGAIHMALQNGKVDVDELIQGMGQLDWRKVNWVDDPMTGDPVNRVFFEGTIVQEGRTVSSRTEFETAAARLFTAARNAGGGDSAARAA